MTRRAVRCPETGKHRHAGKADALAAGARSARHGPVISTYPCEHCAGWHLTSIPRWVEPRLTMAFSVALRRADFEAPDRGELPESPDAAAVLALVVGRWATPAHVLADLLPYGRTKAMISLDGANAAASWHGMAWSKIVGGPA